MWDAKDSVNLLAGSWGGCLQPEVWNGPNHKLIKQGHREVDLAVGRAVNHAFFDQLRSHGTETADFDLDSPNSGGKSRLRKS